jgi:lactobin A/cerein 7B family class IIb bacteriocin
MESMNNDQLKEVKGGAVNWGILAACGAALSFIIGIIDGLMNPKKCNN